MIIAFHSGNPQATFRNGTKAWFRLCTRSRYLKSFSAKFGEVLRRARTRRGLSQERLAELADLDRTFVSMIERGRRRPTLDSAKRLAQALGIPLTKMIASAERNIDQ